VAVKIKLKRLGKIRAPYYRIVVADARTKRDGRAIEEIGKYHPKADPSFIEVDSERAQHWLSVGAQPTDPVRKILEITGDWQKYKGLPGQEGTLRTAEPKEDRKIAFAAALQETLDAGSSTTPKGKSRAKSGESASAKAAPAAKAGKTDKPEKTEKPAKPAKPAKAAAEVTAPAEGAATEAATTEAAAEPATTEPATTKPATTKAATTKAATTDAATTEAATTDAATTEAAATEAATTEAAAPAETPAAADTAGDAASSEG
jgi:small subunit ribosomal protein S16